MPGICYSNLYTYGTNEKDNPIIPPTPVFTVFRPFNYLKPHNFNSNSTWNELNSKKEIKEIKENFLIPNKRKLGCATDSFREDFANNSQFRRENQRLNVGFFSQRFREMSGF